MEDKDLEKPEAAEETAVQPENGRALKEEPEKEKKVLTPEEKIGRASCRERV